jgi:hypothetical protein
MPEQSPDGFEWLDSPAFEQLVELQLVASARRAGLRDVDERAIARVLRWLAANREGARAEERERPVSQQRGPSEALAALDRLVSLAAEAAIATGHDILREADLAGVYQRQLCKYWPFCWLRGPQDETGDEELTVVVGGPDLLAMRVRDIALGRVPA